MKKLVSILIAGMLLFAQMPVFAQTNAKDVFIAGYEEYVTEAIKHSGYNENKIDKDNIYIIEMTNYIALENNEKPVWIFVALPIIGSDDVLYAHFDSGEYVDSIVNFVAFEYSVNPHGEKLNGYIEKNTLSEPVRITEYFVLEGGLHMLAYNVVCNDESYIIPYYFMEDSVFNVTDLPELSLLIGKAYTEDEFINICKKEEEIDAEYRRKQREEESGMIYVDKDGEAVVSVELDNPGEDIKDVSLSDTKQQNEQKRQDEVNEKEVVEVSEVEQKNQEQEDKVIDEADDVKSEKTVTIRNAQECADILYAFGLFKGTEKGYELEKGLTREESAVILVRLLGEEENINLKDYSDVFVDIEKDRWSFDYIMYCYENNITNGTGTNTFSPDAEINAEQFVSLILRLLGYTDVNPDKALKKGIEYGVLNAEMAETLEKSKSFTRSRAVQIVYNSLKTQMKDNTMFAEYLTDRGILTEEEKEIIK